MTVVDRQDDGVSVDVRRYPKGTRPPTEIELTSEQAQIPTSRYTSTDYAEREVARMWKRVWQMACRVEDLPEAGDYVEYVVGDQSYLVVRGDDGQVRAFGNACRHRGNLIKRGRGTARELRCPYHYWTWSLDGALASIPDRELFCPIDDDAYALKELACDTWGGFVFVHPGPDPEPLLDFLGPLPEQLGPYRFEEMVPTTNISTPVAASWKVVVEAFLETYHVQGIHPQLLPMLDDVNTWHETFDTHTRMITPFGVPSPRLGDDVEPQEVFDHYLRSSSTTVRKMTGEGGTGAQPSEAARAKSPLSRLGGDDGSLALPDGQSVRDVLIDALEEAGRAKGHDYSGLTRDQLIDDWHYHIFPNLIFNTHAGGFLFFRVRPDFDDPNRSWFDLMRFQWLAPEERAAWQPSPPQVVEERSVSLGEVLDQDLENLPGVQRGLHSDALDHITVSRHEIRIVKFHEVLDRFLQ